eukprot:5752679-Amphidinium_carterae.1
MHPVTLPNMATSDPKEKLICSTEELLAKRFLGSHKQSYPFIARGGFISSSARCKGRKLFMLLRSLYRVSSRHVDRLRISPELDSSEIQTNSSPTCC